jgi:hypothetical protein
VSFSWLFNFEIGLQMSFLGPSGFGKWLRTSFWEKPQVVDQNKVGMGVAKRTADACLREIAMRPVTVIQLIL